MINQNIALWPVFVAALLLTACGSESVQLSKGQMAPEFRLVDLQQNEARFPQDFTGKVVVIRFWADWCNFCETEMKAIEPVYQKYQQEGLAILALNVRQDRETAAAFIAKLDISYDVLLDTEGQAARIYGVMGLPTTFFVDREGRLHTRVIGESTPEVFEAILDEML